MLTQILITVISGTLVFTLGQIIKDFFLSPLIKQRSLIEQIGYSLSFFGHLYTNIPEKSEKDSIDRQTMYLEFRTLGVSIVSNANLLPFYKIFSAINLIPEKNKIIKAKGELIGLSNGAWPNTHEWIKINSERADKLKELLHIEI